MSIDEIVPFASNVPEDVLVDLKARLARTRWTDQLPGVGWDYGTPLSYLKELCDYWRDGFDWRAAEARINAFPQFVTEIGGERMHFYHVRSPEPDAVPIVITHGWPGSAVEFLDIMGPLSDPRAHGGDPRDAFHVVCPSIPGYGFSGPTRNPGFSMHKAAEANLALMARLGYDRFIAQGGDWGSGISTVMARMAPERLIALHLNFMAGSPPDPADPLAGLNDEEKAYVAWKRDYDANESGYQLIQGTKPQSLAYGLNDSPAGLAAWIVEKFKTWSDCGDDVETSFTKDRLLENITLYWVTETINSANRMYYESIGPGRLKMDAGKVEVPTGHTRYPAEIRRPPRLWAEQGYNIVYWNEVPKGGHFAAFEVPNVFIDEIRTFARMFRS